METSGGYSLDPSVWRSPGGQTLIGGSAFTIVGLTDSQRDALDRMTSGSDSSGIDDSDFRQFLLDRNLVQPVSPPAQPSDVALVVPCRNHQGELSSLLDRLDLTRFTEVVVVDDGSDPPVVVHDGVTLVRHDISLGAGAARNTGWQATRAQLVLFLDADVITDGAWVSEAAGYFLDPLVAAVAPRVRSVHNHSRVGRWESVRPALDLGAARSVVSPRTRVPYLPTAALLVRRVTLDSIGGFDPAMPLGEDVDLVWRLHDQGFMVRYEPEFEVRHLSRSTIGQWIRQRVTDGRSTVALAEKHQNHVVGIELTWWNALPLLLLGRSRLLKLAAIAAGSAGVVILEKRLANRCDNPRGLAIRLQRDGIGYAAASFAQAARRTHWPLALVASLLSKRIRWSVAGAFLSPSWDWLQHGSGTPAREWMTASLVDDVSYGAGLWFESIRTRTMRAVRVHFSRLDRFLPDNVPGVSRRQSR